jgi:hypothetical protein
MEQNISMTDTITKKQFKKIISAKVLSGVKHIGPIPKGCQLQQCEIIAAKERYHISIIVDIVAGTNKSFNQKLVAIKNHVSSYISVTSIEKLLADKRFVLTEMILEHKVVAPETPISKIFDADGNIMSDASNYKEMTVSEIIEKFGDELTDNDKVELERFKG